MHQNMCRTRSISGGITACSFYFLANLVCSSISRYDLSLLDWVTNSHSSPLHFPTSHSLPSLARPPSATRRSHDPTRISCRCGGLIKQLPNTTTTRSAGLRKGQEIPSRNLDIWWCENHALTLMQYKFKLYLCIPRRYRELDKISNLAHFFVMLTNRNAADQPCWPIIRMAQNFEMKWLIDKMNMLLNALDIIIHLQHFA